MSPTRPAREDYETPLPLPLPLPLPPPLLALPIASWATQSWQRPPSCPSSSSSRFPGSDRVPTKRGRRTGSEFARTVVFAHSTSRKSTFSLEQRNEHIHI